MLAKIRTAITLNKARSLGGTGRLNEASQSLSALFARYGSAEPTLEAPLLANLLAADLFQRQHKYADAAQACAVVFQQIRGRKLVDSPSFTENDLSYLYLVSIWIVMSGDVLRNSMRENLFGEALNLPKVTLDSVKPIARDMFPMTGAEMSSIKKFLGENAL